MTDNMPFQLEILYQDEDLLVVNKPPGIVVNDAQTVPGETIQGWMRLELSQKPITSNWEALVPNDFDPEFGSPQDIFDERQGMVHRLDKNTSGVLVWAKNPGSLVNLLAQFKTRQVEKYYTALVHGKIDAPQATLNYPLGRASRDRKVFAVTPEGRPAVTEYQVQQLFQGLDAEKIVDVIWPQIGDHPRLVTQIKTPSQLLKRLDIYQGFSLIECHPLTGRTHQIRVHLAHIRHPLVGDVTYIGRKRQVLDPLWCPRHFLHASRLRLTHPRSGEVMEFVAPLPLDLRHTLELLLPS